MSAISKTRGFWRRSLRYTRQHAMSLAVIATPVSIIFIIIDIATSGSGVQWIAIDILTQGMPDSAQNTVRLISWAFGVLMELGLAAGLFQGSHYYENVADFEGDKGKDVPTIAFMERMFLTVVIICVSYMVLSTTAGVVGWLWQWHSTKLEWPLWVGLATVVGLVFSVACLIGSSILPIFAFQWWEHWKAEHMPAQVSAHKQLETPKKGSDVTSKQTVSMAQDGYASDLLARPGNGR